MEEFVSFGSRTYWVLLTVLLLARAADFFSTWIATPNMVLEGNPVAKRLGWTWGIPLNVGLCVAFSFWPLPAIVISTTSVLVAARNFQSAWLMRSLGEHMYREWHVARVQESSMILYMFCLLAQTALIGLVGAAVIYFSDWQEQPVIPAIGLGIIAYAGAVLIFTGLSIIRFKRSANSAERLAARSSSEEPTE